MPEWKYTDAQVVLIAKERISELKRHLDILQSSGASEGKINLVFNTYSLNKNIVAMLENKH